MTNSSISSRHSASLSDDSRHNNDDAFVGFLVAPVTPDTHSGGIDMADSGVIGVSVTAVIAISRVAVTVTGIAIGRSVSVTIAVSGIAIAVAIIRITVAITV